MTASLPYHVYLDLDVINNDFSSSPPPLLKFEETRNAPFLDGSSSDYFCSIVRFSIQTANSLPVFIPQIDTKAADPINTTIYKISFVYKKQVLPFQLLQRHILLLLMSCLHRQ